MVYILYPLPPSLSFLFKLHSIQQLHSTKVFYYNHLFKDITYIFIFRRKPPLLPLDTFLGARKTKILKTKYTISTIGSKHQIVTFMLYILQMLSITTKRVLNSSYRPFS
jgi:hypothetical protein